MTKKPSAGAAITLSQAEFDDPEEPSRARIVYLIRRAALALPAQDPVAPALRQVVADLLIQGDDNLAPHISRQSLARTLTLVESVLALDPHAADALRDIHEALQTLLR